MAVHQQRNVAVGGCIIAQQPLQVDLARRRTQDVPAADDFRDAGERVVHDDRQLIGEQAVRAAEDHVAAVPLKLLADRAEVAVHKGYVLVRYAQAHGGRARLCALGDLPGREGGAGAVVDRLAVAQVRRLRGVQLGARAEARVDQAHGAQFVKIPLIDRRALALI